MSVQTIVAAITREPAKRELYLAAMTFVAANPEGALRFAVEEAVEAAPERATFFQPAGSLVDALVTFSALAEELPEPTFDEDTEEEYIDMARASYRLTEEGAEALQQLSPNARLSALVARQPQWAEAFSQLLDFCRGTKRSRQEIDALLTPLCEQQENQRHVAALAVYPSFFVDSLARAGALKWANGWTTVEGAAVPSPVFQ